MPNKLIEQPLVKIGDPDEPPPSNNFWDIVNRMVHSWQKGLVPTQRKQMVYILGMSGGSLGICKFTNMVFW